MKKSHPTASDHVLCTISNLFPLSAREDLPTSGVSVPETAIPLELEGVSVLFSRTIDAMPADWESATDPDNIFLQRSYFEVLEACPPDHMEFGYLLFYRGERPVGVAGLQLLDFKADRDIQALQADDRPSGWQTWFKKVLASFLRFRVLVCGNMLLTGSHGFHFTTDQVDASQSVSLLRQAMDRISNLPRAFSNSVHALLIKDIPKEARDGCRSLTEAGYHRIAFQPNMVVSIRREWNEFDDYLASMTSKYRVRARRAFKKARKVDRREMSLAEVEERADTLYVQYRNIAHSADFNMVQLDPKYLIALKRRFPALFRVHGYYLEGELVGYCTTLRNGPELEAHFLGFVEPQNRRNQLYLNMLYDMIWEGIAAGVERVIFARTALEIKSSVGARPEPMDLYLRSQWKWFNPLVPRLIDLLEPKTEWTPRHPFK